MLGDWNEWNEGYDQFELIKKIKRLKPSPIDINANKGYDWFDFVTFWRQMPTPINMNAMCQILMQWMEWMERGVWPA